MGAAAVSCQNETPRGFIGSVIICWWPTDTYTWGPSSAAAGMGNSVVIGRLCHDVEGAVDQAPLDVLRSPEVRLDPPTQSRQLDYLCVRERRLRLPGRVDHELLRASSGERFDRELL